jgi:hypothetical protein
MTEFAKGVTVKERTFEDGGSVINLSFDVTEFYDNPINNDRWINLTLKRGKESGKLYAVNNEYYQRGENEK